MAQIPIFDGGAPSQPVDIRPTRMGEHIPPPVGYEKVGAMATETTNIINKMTIQHQQNQADAIHASYDQALVNADMVARATPIKSQDDLTKVINTYMAGTDPKQFLATAQQKATKDGLAIPAIVMNHVMPNLSIMQSGRLAGITQAGMVSFHNSNVADLETNLDSIASLTGQSGTNDYALQKQKGLDAIATAQKVGTVRPEEAVSYQKKFLNSVDQYGAQGFVHSNPSAAMQMFTDPKQYLKQYPNLTPGQAQSFASQAHGALSQQLEGGDQWMKQQKLMSEQEFIKRDQAGTLTEGWVQDQVQHHNLPSEYYTGRFGRPVPALDNPTQRSTYMSMVSNPNADYATLQSTKLAIIGDPNLSANDKRLATTAADQRLQGLHSPIDMARRSTATNVAGEWDSHLSTITAGNPAALMEYGGNRGIAAAKAHMMRDLNDKLYNATSPEDVDRIEKNFDYNKYLPSGLRADSKVPLPGPPPVNLPSDITSKIVNFRSP